MQPPRIYGVPLYSNVFIFNLIFWWFAFKNNDKTWSKIMYIPLVLLNENI